MKRSESSWKLCWLVTLPRPRKVMVAGAGLASPPDCPAGAPPVAQAARARGIAPAASRRRAGAGGGWGWSRRFLLPVSRVSRRDGRRGTRTSSRTSGGAAGRRPAGRRRPSRGRVALPVYHLALPQAQRTSPQGDDADVSESARTVGDLGMVARDEPGISPAMRDDHVGAAPPPGGVRSGPVAWPTKRSRRPMPGRLACWWAPPPDVRWHRRVSGSPPRPRPATTFWWPTPAPGADRHGARRARLAARIRRTLTPAAGPAAAGPAGAPPRAPSAGSAPPSSRPARSRRSGRSRRSSAG